MPATLNSISRRQFIARSLAALAGTLVVPKLFGAYTPPNPHRFALLTDTHINAPDTHPYHVTDNCLRRVVGEIIHCRPLPMAAFVLGDLAFNSGECADYERFFKLMEPVRNVGIPIHLAVGNHDDRRHFWEMYPPENTPVANRHVTIVPTERANFFILDSQDGTVGEQQLNWLTNALDAEPDFPAIIMVHHYPLPPGKSLDPKSKSYDLNALRDTQALFDVILPRKHVKALFFGHSHTWNVSSRFGLHLISLPWIGTGWVDLLLDHGSAQLNLSTLEPQPKMRKHLTLLWRKPTDYALAPGRTTTDGARLP
ncbi:MAG: metallophosphoesterase [Verrucomicrobiota bacterium]